MTNELPPVTVIKGDPADDELAALVASLVAAANNNADDTDPGAEQQRKERLRWRNSLQQSYTTVRNHQWRW